MQSELIIKLSVVRTDNNIYLVIFIGIWTCFEAFTNVSCCFWIKCHFWKSHGATEVVRVARSVAEKSRTFCPTQNSKSNYPVEKPEKTGAVHHGGALKFHNNLEKYA